jgi:hypothetical protein
VGSNESSLREILDKIAGASFVLSGSLHGAIIACAYNRPFAFWDSGMIDIPFKWDDFSASVGIPSVFVKNVEEAVAVYEMQLKPKIKKPPLTPILDACPFAIKPSKLVLAMAADGLIEWEMARVASQHLSGLRSEDSGVIHTLQDRAAQVRNPHLRMKSLLIYQAVSFFTRAKAKVHRIAKFRSRAGLSKK